MKLSTRVAGIAGIVFVIAIAVPGFASGAPPNTDDPASKYLSYVQDNRSALITSAFFGMVGLFFVAFFLGGLYAALRRQGASAGLLVASLIAIVLTGSVAATGSAVEVGSVFRFNGSAHVDAGVIQLLFDLQAACFILIGFTLSAFLLATATMMATAAYFPRWLAWFGWLAAALEVAGTVAVFGTSGFYSLDGPAGILFGLAPFGIFMLATGIVMVLRGNAMDGVASGAAEPARPAALPVS